MVNVTGRYWEFGSGRRALGYLVIQHTRAQNKSSRRRTMRKFIVTKWFRVTLRKHLCKEQRLNRISRVSRRQYLFSTSTAYRSRLCSHVDTNENAAVRYDTVEAENGLKPNHVWAWLSFTIHWNIKTSFFFHKLPLSINEPQVGGQIKEERQQASTA